MVAHAPKLAVHYVGLRKMFKVVGIVDTLVDGVMIRAKARVSKS
jgi:hypothetical protein